MEGLSVRCSDTRKGAGETLDARNSRREGRGNVPIARVRKENPKITPM